MLDDNAKEAIQFKELVPFVITIITGAVGGCVASFQKARSRRETMAAYMIGYTITGIFGGMVALAMVMIMFPDMILTLGHHVLIGSLAGLGVSCVMALGNISMRIVLKNIGMEVLVTVQRIKKED